MTRTAAAGCADPLEAGMGEPVALAGALVDAAAGGVLRAGFVVVELLHPAASRQAVIAIAAGNAR